MKKIISILIVIYCVVNIHAGAQDSIKTTEPQQVVGGGEATRPNADQYLKVIEVKNDGVSSCYHLSTFVDSYIGQEDYYLNSIVNTVLRDRSIPAKIFREVFTFDELHYMRNKQGTAGSSIDMLVSFNQQGKIFDIMFVYFHRNDARLRQIITPERLKTLFIKLRDRAHYSMPSPVTTQNDYMAIFDVKFSDVLLGKPVMQYVPGED